MSLTTLGQTLVAGLANGAFYALLALPFSVIFALTRALNLAHGELVVLGGYVGYAVGRVSGLPPALLAPLAAVALLPVGLVWRALLVRVQEPVELNSLVLTFGLSLTVQNGLQAVWSADYRLIPLGADVDGAVLGLAPARAAAAVVAIVILGGLQLVLTHTRLGAALRATSRDAEAAALLGINVDRVGWVSFAVAAAIAGGSGVLFAALHYLQPAAGVELTLLAITLAIWGGTWRRLGPLGGLLAGGLVFGLVEALVLAGAGPGWREPVVAAVLLAVLLARPRGRAGLEVA